MDDHQPTLAYYTDIYAAEGDHAGSLFEGKGDNDMRG
jgi:hypothetical protein